jgi:hypothetical protein
MQFTRDMAVAFGDWLEREQIRRMLLSGRPELQDVLELDGERPLLRIRRGEIGPVIVARLDEQDGGPWLVGVAGSSEPVLHEASSPDEAARIALEALAPCPLAG